MTIAVSRVRPYEEEIVELGEFLVMAAAESALAPPDAVKAMEQGFATVAEGVAFVARDEAGEIVGSLGLYFADFWYAHGQFMATRWFFVRPDRRREDVGSALLLAARLYAERSNLAAFVEITTPRRTPADRASRWAEIVGYIPVGHTLRLH
jgi:GNAT superfamily N-acetyltransferase